MAKEKCFQFHNSTVYVGTFDSLDDFLFYVRDENVNYMFVDKMASKSSDYYFTGTNSYEEAWNLCRYGMSEGFIQFADKTLRLRRQYALSRSVICDCSRFYLCFFVRQGQKATLFFI